MRNVIIRPIISEKSLTEAKIGRFTFLVDKNAIKTQIAKAIEDQYKVKVIGVSTTNMKAVKNIRTKARVITKKAPYKKARVKLAKGQKIDAFDEKKGKKDK